MEICSPCLFVLYVVQNEYSGERCLTTPYDDSGLSHQASWWYCRSHYSYIGIIVREFRQWSCLLNSIEPLKLFPSPWSFVWIHEEVSHDSTVFGLLRFPLILSHERACSLSGAAVYDEHCWWSSSLTSSSSLSDPASFSYSQSAVFYSSESRIWWLYSFPQVWNY